MLTDITRQPGNNPGGNCQLQYSPAYNISFYPTIVKSVATGDLVFNTGQRYFNIEFIERSLNFDEQQSTDENGSPYKVTITAVVRGDGATLRPLLHELSQVERLVVKIRDNSGLTRLVGTSKEWLTFTYKFATGDDTSKLRSYNIQFTGIFSKPAALMP